jgi:hypothetical protein
MIARLDIYWIIYTPDAGTLGGESETRYPSRGEDLGQAERWEQTMKDNVGQ